MVHFSPKVSVIIPVYNVEKYLPECIESVLTQTLQDFELLLIDDGSKDTSGKICDRYATTDNRIRVFHQTNQGVSTSRNFGIDHARSEWICFIDSDDYIGENYLDAFINHGHLSEDCLNLQGWSNIDDSGKSAGSVNYPDLLSYGETMADNISKYRLFGSNAPWGKLFNRTTINRYHIRFPIDLPVREDAIFSYNYRLHMKSIQLISASEYYYRLPGKRITLSHYNHPPQVFLTIRETLPPLIKEVFQHFSLHGSDYEKATIGYFKNNTCLSIIKSTYAYHTSHSNRINTLHTIFDDKAYFNDPSFRINKLLRFFKCLYQFCSAYLFDMICFIPFRFYYKCIRRKNR